MNNKVEAAQGANVFSALVSKIMSILKLDDAGKLSKFFEGEVKSIKNGIKAIEMNKQTAALQHEMALSEVDSQIEDAEEALADSYTAVTVEEINSNDAMKSFSAKYWGNIEHKERALQSLKDDRKARVEAYDKALEARNNNIAKQEARIAAIS
jgi:hypothetical protein